MLYSSDIDRRRLLLGAIALLLPPTLAGAQPPASIRMASSGNYPPFTVLDSAGRMTGILPDLLAQVGEAAGLRFDFADLPWARAQKMVEQSQIDALCTIATEERHTYADFAPTPLYDEPYVLVYRAGNRLAEGVRAPRDLAGLRLAVPLGSGLLREALPTQQLQWVADIDNLLAMLVAGHLDGALLGAWTIHARLKTYRDAALLRATEITLPADSAVRFGLRKSFPAAADILARVDAAIVVLEASGTVDAIIARHLA